MVREGLKNTPGSGLFSLDETSAVHFPLLDCLWKKGLKKRDPMRAGEDRGKEDAGAFQTGS